MDLYAKMSSNMDELTSAFDARMHQYENDLKVFSSTDPVPHKDLDTLTREFVDFKTLIWKTLSMMRSQLELLVQGMDRQETISRRKVLLFHGIAESKDVAIDDSIVKILNDKFKMSHISAEHLSNCHRLGTNTSKPRPVLVRFASYKLRNQVWNAKTSLKSSGITVSEFLTKTRHEVFTLARQHFGIKQCWTSDGMIIVLLPDNKRRRIEAMSELRPLIAEHSAVQTGADKQTPGASQDKGKTTSLPVSKAAPRVRRTVK